MRFLFFYLILFNLSALLFAQDAPIFFGVQTHFGQFYRADMDSNSVKLMLDSVKQAGIRCIRDEAYWSDIETQKGVFNFPPAIDFYVKEAKKRNIEVLLILDYNNKLYADHSSSGVASDSNRAAFARYCQEVVRHFKPMGVKYYEIWNEPNIPVFWDPAPDASLYAELLKTVYPAIKEIDSTAFVMACATSPAEGEPSPFINWLDFIKQVINAGGGENMDGVSFHLYRFNSPETYLFQDIDHLQKIVGSDKPLFLTEFGLPTSSVWPNISYQQQAQYFSRLLLLGRTVPQLKLISYYDLKDDGEDPSNNEHNFGLIAFDYKPKPAFLFYKM
ncbi:MAG: glycoside hydrolase family 5 protein [Calditrichaeota bacterium]|nr:glycoside hydrolase family 5 protein [Calditrichota bacterium]